jgi:hypothetical protein
MILGSGVDPKPDPDPHESALKLVGWIRFRIQVDENDPQK